MFETAKSLFCGAADVLPGFFAGWRKKNSKGKYYYGINLTPRLKSATMERNEASGFL